MDNKTRNPVAQKLLEAFSRFHRLNWKRSPIKGLKSSEIMVLYCIKKTRHLESPGIKVSEISRFLKVSRPTVTQLVNSLEANGYVERTMDQEDRRAVRVILTEKGQWTIEEVSGAFFASFDGLVEYLGEEKSSELADLLARVFVYFNEQHRGRI